MDLYFSADVETDGPIPGPYSMLSFGLVIAGSFDGTTFRRSDLSDSFEANLRPISENFEEEALAVTGIDREALKRSGKDPSEAMKKLADWIEARCAAAESQTKAKVKPVLVAYPLGFDWSFLHWYFLNFAGRSPFGHSRGLDIKTAYAIKAGVPLHQASRSKLPEHLRSALPHTHGALDDAKEQADIFANIMEWQP